MDCLNPDEENRVPWLEIDAANCRNIPINIEFKMCNRNQNERIQIIPETTRFMFMGEELEADEKKQWIEPMSCRTKFIDRIVDTCRTPKQRPMSVLLNARIIRDENVQVDNSHCFCKWNCVCHAYDDWFPFAFCIFNCCSFIHSFIHLLIFAYSIIRL